jgi:phospholipase C
MASLRFRRPDLRVQFQVTKRCEGSAVEHSGLHSPGQYEASGLRAGSACGTGIASAGVGGAPSRALPYELHVRARTDLTQGAVNIFFGNTGKIGVVYQVYAADGQSGPWTYTVAPDTELADLWNLTSNGQTDYHLSVFGPNAFLRVFKGSIAPGKADITSNIVYDTRSNGVTLGIHNRTRTELEGSVFDDYRRKALEFRLPPNGEQSEFFLLERSYGWYDFKITTPSDPSFQHRLAGHLETGRDSMSDPAIGTVQPQASHNQTVTSP